MANQTIEIKGITTGMTLVTKGIFPKGSATVVAGTVGLTVTEISGKPTHYRLVTTAAISGWHDVVLEDGDATAIGTWEVFLTNATAVHYAVPDLSGTTIGGITGGGTGARTVSITVNDGATALPNALVRLTNGGETFTATTNGSGVATFNVNDGTWTVSITKAGYSYAGTTLVVDGNETVTYSISLIAISTPSDPDFCTLAIRVWGKGTGAVASGVTVKVQITDPPSGDGELFNDDIMTDVTGADGYATFTVPKDCSVRYWVGEREKQIDRIDDDTVEYVKNWLGHE